MNEVEKYCTEKVKVYGKELVDEVYEIEEIVVEKRLPRVDNFSPLSQKIANMLNESNDAVGKNWVVLEDGQGYSIVVSDVFKKEDKKRYKSYAVEIERDRIGFKTYQHDLDELPNKKTVPTKMLDTQVEELIKILGGA